MEVTVQEWLGPVLFKALGQYLEGELGVEEVDMMRLLEAEHVQAIQGMLKPMPLKKFNLKYKALMDGQAPSRDSASRTPSTSPVASPTVAEAVPPDDPTIHRIHRGGGMEPQLEHLAPTIAIPSSIKDFVSAYCIFGSMRFPIPEEARQLFEALRAAAGVHLKIVDIKAGQDIDREVYEWIEHCSAFLVMGTKNYGEDTGNSACTYNEVKFAQAKKKNIILLRMIPWEDEFEELQARVLFNRNMLTLEWQQGQEMPTSLVPEIVKAMQLPADGPGGATAAHVSMIAAPNARAEVEAAKRQADKQMQEAQAVAAAALVAKAEAEEAAAQEVAKARADAEAEVAKARAEAEDVREKATAAELARQRSKAAAEAAAREQDAREKAAHEKAAVAEAAAREQAANAQVAREKAAREKAAREKAAAQEQAARETHSSVHTPWARQTFATAVRPQAGGGMPAPALAAPNARVQTQPRDRHIAGLTITGNHQTGHWHGVYSREGVQDDGWPYFRHVQGHGFLFHSDRSGTSMWYIYKRRLEHCTDLTLSQATRTQSEVIPMGTHQWTGWDGTPPRQTEFDMTLAATRCVQRYAFSATGLFWQQFPHLTNAISSYLSRMPCSAM